MSKQVVLKNGRKDYSELKKSFEKVLVQHEYQKGGTVRTTALLVQDGIVHVGVSKFSNRGNVFSKSKGSQAALGRAELAANIMHGVETPRKSKEKRREELSYSLFSSNEKSVDSIIASFITTPKASQES
jgi:hypothetical protein